MKRYSASIMVDVQAETPAARDALLLQMVVGMEARPARVFFPDIGSADVRGAKLGRVRPKGKR